MSQRGLRGAKPTATWRGTTLRYAQTSGALALACLALAFVHFSGLARPLDNDLSALRASLTPRAPSGDVVVIEIDAASLRAAREWPWPRERYARVIRNLHAAGADLIGFDVDFSARSSGDNDAHLQQAIDSEPGRIVLPTFVQTSDLSENRPLASISSNALFGSVNIPVDRDGRVRRYWRGVHTASGYQASMASVLSGAQYGLSAPFVIDYGIRAADIAHLSFEDVYRGTFDPSLVQGKTVLIGATALELGDEFATPVRPSMSGVYVHALAFESLRQGRALLEVNDIIILALGLAALAFLWPRRGPLHLRRLLVRHALVLAVALAGPLMLQRFAPVSLDTAFILVAQALCIWMTVQRELARRAQELVRQREAHFNYVALHDPETALPNRRAMLEELARRLTGGDTVAVIAIGIDRFATMRGAIGYVRANEIVERLAQRLGDGAGRSSVFHLSTSILGMVLAAPDEAGARALSQDILEQLDTTVLVDDQAVETNVRLGATLAHLGVSTPEKVLEEATIALDQARIQNREHVFYNGEEFDPKLQFSLLSDMAKGLERGEFRMVYQAKAEARGGGLEGAEALMRWRHGVHGQISPDRFITVAEETGAIDLLTRWAVLQVVADQAELRAQEIDITLSVNISGRCLCNESFCDFAIETVQRTGAKLCFEITETAIIEDPLAAMSIIAALREAKIKISIDDYGSGLSSLAYLKQIPADELKLDKSLIRDLSASARDRLILKSTIDLAHSLNLSVVAEGVEDHASATILAGMGCDVLQGFLISHPLALKDFLGAYGASDAHQRAARLSRGARA